MRKRATKQITNDWPCRHPGCTRTDGPLGTHRCAEHRVPYPTDKEWDEFEDEARPSR